MKTTLPISTFPKTEGCIFIIGGKLNTRHLLRDILQPKGYQVSLFKDFKLSGDSDKRPLPDLILLSTGPWKKDIFNYFQQLKQDPLFHDIPTILTGSFRDQNIKREYLQAGCSDFIETPFHIEEVHNKVHTHISLHLIQKDLSSRLAEKTNDLSLKTEELEETIIALKVLLKQHEADKKKLELTMLENLSLLIEPTLEKLMNTHMNETQKAYLDILHTNLQHIATPLLKSADMDIQHKLTPSEIQISNLIKNGRTTKEIADLLHLSPMTVATHRRNIRKK